MRRPEVPTGATLLGEPLPVELMNTLRVERSDVQDALNDDATVTAWLQAIDDRLRSETGSQDPVDVAAAPEPGLAERLRRLRNALRRLAPDAVVTDLCSRSADIYGPRWVWAMLSVVNIVGPIANRLPSQIDCAGGRAAPFNREPTVRRR
jgi:Putative stress-induced transcription regulator